LTVVTRLVQVVGGLLAVGGVLWIAFLVSFRTGFRPVLDAIRRMNRRVTNPRQMRTAGQPGAYASVVHHVGRVSGQGHRTPVVVVPAENGFAIALPYGASADWVRNVLAAGTATVEHEGRTVPVARPELVPAAAADPFFPPKERRLHRLYGVEHVLRLQPADAG
jgi:deazaflavin-dependent oxidoreductase (nitroreductase family)